MNKHRIRHVAVILLPLLAMIMSFTSAAVADEDYGPAILGVAIDGYDPVAYFTKGQAMQGSEAYTYYWDDAEWRFINAEHRDLFAANPKKYTPRHGGF